MIFWLFPSSCWPYELLGRYWHIQQGHSFLNNITMKTIIIKVNTELSKGLYCCGLESAPKQISAYCCLSANALLSTSFRFFCLCLSSFFLPFLCFLLLFLLFFLLLFQFLISYQVFLFCCILCSPVSCIPFFT